MKIDRKDIQHTKKISELWFSILQAVLLAQVYLSVILRFCVSWLDKNGPFILPAPRCVTSSPTPLPLTGGTALCKLHDEPQLLGR